MQQAIASGSVIDKRYQIQKQLPDTTSNRCYLAEDAEQSNRLVVISFPKMELQTLPGFAAAFDDACQRLIKVRLNGLLKILGYGEHNSQPYSITQYVTHETLESHLVAQKAKEQKTAIDDVLDWARPLAVTLDELHELGYVHSNVRPAAIFLGEKRQVLLGDFTTELALQRLGAFKQAISSLDIADHLAPEYIKSHYNESYDQYLLATILYEALARRSHFHNPGSSEAYRRQVATKFPEPLLPHRPELVGASRILGKALERNPTKRFETCREFVNQLGSAQVSPAFANFDDKPVTVIKKVLDLDETASSEPIVTTVRSDHSTGRKKRFIWLGVLLLGLGAYAVNHFSGVGQTTTVGDLPEEPSTIVPVEPSSGALSATRAIAVTSSSAEAGATEEASASVDNANEVLSVDGVGLSSAVSQALAEGQAEFIASNAINSDMTVSAKKVDVAVDQALQEAQIDYMQQTSPAESKVASVEADTSTETPVVAESAGQLPDGSAEVPLVEPAGAIGTNTENNNSLSLTDVEAQKLNEQMLLASEQLADERKVAKLAEAKENKRPRDLGRNADAEVISIAKQAVTPSVKTFDAMQKEREKLQAIKAKKIAHISNVTKDCLTGGEIYRQVAAGNLPYVKNCLSVGIDANLAQNNRRSLLHQAALGGYLNMAKLLVAKGADVNAKAADGKTPLDMAAEHKKDRLVTYLRSRGGVDRH